MEAESGAQVHPIVEPLLGVVSSFLSVCVGDQSTELVVKPLRTLVQVEVSIIMLLVGQILGFIVVGLA